MSTTEHAETSVRFADILLRAHHAMPRSPDDPVQRCACGRAEVLCEINSAARDAGLLTPINAQASDPNSAVTVAAGPATQDRACTTKLDRSVSRACASRSGETDRSRGRGSMIQLFPGVGAGSLLNSQLLADDRSTRIGAVYRIDYGEAIVLTHDRWKFDAGGIPQYSFLLATAQNISAPQVDDDEVLLLRVEGTSSLSMESDLHAVREESLRAALSGNPDPSPSAVLDVEMDAFTKNRVPPGWRSAPERDAARRLDGPGEPAPSAHAGRTSCQASG